MKKCMVLIAGLLSFFYYSCNNKKVTGDDAAYFPVLSFLQSQVKDIDTSMYSIMKIVTVDSLADTAYIKRQDFRKLANDFLNIPDLTAKKYAGLYTESRFFDESLKRVVITYSPKQDDLEIRRQEIQIIPNEAGGDRVQNIIIDKLISSKDSVVQKKLLWTINEGFQVITLLQKPGQRETTEILKVTWK